MSDIDEILKCLIAIIIGYLFSKYILSGFIFGNGFTPGEVMDTSLADLNKAGCCVGNTAGYGVNPVAVSPAAPGFARIGAYSNPCIPMN